MKISKPTAYRKAGIDLTKWEFEDPLLDGPNAIPQRDEVLTIVSDALRYVLTKTDPLMVTWGDTANLEIMLCLGEVDDGIVEWTLPLTALLETIADDIASGDMSRKKQVAIAKALKLTAERILSGEYAPRK